jgi:hypothetical protein
MDRMVYINRANAQRRAAALMLPGRPSTSASDHQLT